MGVSGLRHPEDLAAWHAWQRRSRPVTSRARTWATRRWSHHRAPWVAYTTSEPPVVLVALEADTPSSTRALLAPVRHLLAGSPETAAAGPGTPGADGLAHGRGVADGRGLADAIGVAVVTPQPLREPLPGGPWTCSTVDARAVAALAAGARAVLATGHYLPVGAAAYRATAPGRFLTVQHGVLTPDAPPLAAGTRLLAWSAADARFWCGARDDVAATPVGSQLLWEAADAAAPPRSPAKRPVYLGQLHAAELDRRALVRSAEAFCRAEHAVYRPHPSERDRASRAQHARWRAGGIRVEAERIPLAALGAPVVSVFSTGVLEAAASGLPAWVHLLDPPPWLRELWSRYGMAEWGGAPTPVPAQPVDEPARAIAAILRDMLGVP